ncbi:MAG: DinG family ATP-dependent helicase [Herbaspirillum sp.]|nr:DinG family ATP-dependent helicase [Herbaspirillum sp.]
MNPTQKYVIAVRALCEFTAKQGDLDLRFTPSPSAQEGIAGHTVVTGRRAAGYRTEVSLSGEFGRLQVRGRADGYDPAHNQLEEIKTFRGDLDSMPDNHRHLHWAQVKIYGHLLCHTESLSDINLALVYYDIGSGKETLLKQSLSADALRQYFEDQCGRFLAWAEQELAHRTERDLQLHRLSFPHPAFRPGQRQLAAAVYKTAAQGRCLLAQAPTGIGKTVGTLFPLLKAAPTQAIDKVFYLAAKTSGRKLALDALALIKNSAPALPLRVLEMVARDKACEHPDKACHGASCPLAKGFYDRLPQARSAAIAGGAMDKTALREIASAHAVCPYYLSQDLARWSDVVVGDYNYYFDLGAMLHSLSVANQWRVGVLVDEAHNMIERARKMYSAELDQRDLKTLRNTLGRAAAPAPAPALLKKALDRLNRQWNALYKDQPADYQVHAAVAQPFLNALQYAIADITDYLSDHPSASDDGLQRFYFDALHFSRIAELFDCHSLFDIAKRGGKTGSNSAATTATLSLRNIVSAPFLAQRFGSAHSVALFSATLSPWHFYSDMLGLPDDTAWIDVASPFSAEQLSVQVIDRISTRYRHRDDSLAPIVGLIAAQYMQQPGNYLAFFSSYDYLQKVSTLLKRLHPAIPILEQARQMDEAERERFLERFTHTSNGIGFAVLGGSFAEGIDLPGQRLIGAFIATLGLPQINPVNEQIMQRMQTLFGHGYDYTYLYPGIQKVVQAAGRVIRSQQDRGVVYLIDDRFTQADVRCLLPPWWEIQNNKPGLAR